MKIVIVGGVAGGASAAARARRLSETSEIILLERGEYVSFANCGLPYYVGDEIRSRDKLIVTSPQRLRERFRIDVRTGSNAMRIDRNRKVIVVQKVATGEIYEESYDKLVLSPGASPIKPPIEGIELPGVMTLRTLEDVDRLRASADRGIQHAVVVGAGFIGLEMVENLVRRGIQTTLIQLGEQIFSVLDREMTTPILQKLREKKIDIRLGTTVGKLSSADGRLKAQLTNNEAIETDLVLFGIGVRPENQLATDAGLAIGVRGGIVTNDVMQTNDPDIYAVGDVVEVQDSVLGTRAQVPLAGPANRQGRLAIDHIMGRVVRYRGTQGTAIVRVFETVAGCTGASEQALLREKRSFQKIYLHPANHAGYYPGAQGMSIKLMFEAPSGRILGAQIVGGEGVDKRIDVLSMAIQASMTVYDLEHVELAYAPQFGSAKDPINMAGFIASGVLRRDHPIIHVNELDRLANRVLIDVRTPEEHALGSIPGALLIPVDQLRDRLGEIPREQPIVTYCQVGQRGYIAARILAQAGLDVRNLSGGYRAFQLFHPA